ncbi:MAG: hypothetical protein AVDCRST_MAG88-4384, partial [uncultured Thermomicrobiales bacterium]
DRHDEQHSAAAAERLAAIRHP